MKLTFLLGSGISLPAGLPSVGEITEKILAGDGMADRRSPKLSGGHSHPREVEECERDRRILVFLDWLKAQAACRYAEVPGRSVNYEDLAYLASQISDDIGDEYENPAISPFVRNALIELDGMFRDLNPGVAQEHLRKLADDAVDHIRWTVLKLLRISLKDASYLNFFVEACRDNSVTEVNLFTLNHDTLIEEFLRSEFKNENINVVDGLRETSNGDGSRRWDHRVFDERFSGHKPVNVLKLHGSTDWSRWEPSKKTKPHELSKENVDRDGRFSGSYQQTDTPLFNYLTPALILVGTFNKIFQYNSEIFLELHHRFHRALQDSECKNLVVCGYGFGDKGVNTRITEWRHQSYENRLLIIDPVDKMTICQKARGAIYWDIESSLCQQEASNAASNSEEEPLDILINQKSQHGPVKHLRKGIGKRPDDKDIEVVTWEEVRRRLIGNDDEFRL